MLNLVKIGLVKLLPPFMGLAFLASANLCSHYNIDDFCTRFQPLALPEAVAELVAR